MAALIRRFLPIDGEGRAALDAFARRTLTNWNGIETGEIRAAGPLFE